MCILDSLQTKFAIRSKCLSTLDALEWPSKKIQGFQLDLMSQEKAKAFKSAFLELLMLQKMWVAVIEF